MTDDDLLLIGMDPQEIAKRGYIVKRMEPLRLWWEIDKLKGKLEPYDMLAEENFLFTYNKKPEDIPIDDIKKDIVEEIRRHARFECLFNRAY